ncbi:hypothetical protein ES703_105916 [subsurface metagenome]
MIALDCLELLDIHVEAAVADEADEDRVRKKGYCTRSKEWTPANKVCTGFYWINDEYTPLIGCLTCKYWGANEEA